MIETVAGELPMEAQLTLPEAVATRFAELAGQLVKRSQIVWGEHCSECGYPLCYSTCEFYSPRPDLHCRRFVAGIEKVKSSTTPGIEPMRIRFRRWGKLEGAGPVLMRSPRAAGHIERVDRAASQALALVPMPYVVRRGLASRWNSAKKRGTRDAEARNSSDASTAFVIEAWSVDGRRHPFTVSFVPPAGHSGGMFQARFEVSPEYSRTVIPAALIAERINLSQRFLIQIEPVGEAAGCDVVFGMCDFAAFAGALPVNVPAPQPPRAATLDEARKAKVVVWDLDETLWHGTLAESGFEGVQLRPGVAEIIRELDARGILQSIASKNDHDEALAALKALGLAQFFLYPQVGWGPKSDSVRRIAASLDLGTDSFVFIDDQPFERNEVLAAHPNVRVLAETHVPELLRHAWFDLPVTAESRARRSMYEAEMVRGQAFESSGTDYLAFLRSCDIVLELRPLSAQDAERVHELSQRTNQLNFTGLRLTREDVARLMAPNANQLCLSMRCSDRFGDYGLIGFAVLDLQGGWVSEFFMSCRVQRKRVEHAFFAYVNARMAERGHGSVRARFRKTARNGTAQTLLTELGFTLLEAPDGTCSYERRSAGFADSDVVRIVDGSVCEVAS